MTTGAIRTGTAGWVFEPWRDTFFPDGLVQKKELAYASSRLGTIEINATFRANQKPESFAKWAGEAREGFVFSIKGPQLVTHIKRLKNCEQELANFFASGPLALGAKLGPFVWQLPPNVGYNREVLSAFLALLPRTTSDYAALAGKADERLKSKPFLGTDGVGEIRHAIEMRNASFDLPEVNALLRQYNVARVISDTAESPGAGAGRWWRISAGRHCRLGRYRQGLGGRGQRRVRLFCARGQTARPGQCHRPAPSRRNRAARGLSEQRRQQFLAQATDVGKAIVVQ